MKLLVILQQEGIDRIKQKIAEAPDKSYEIGVFIATLLPYVVLVVLAYMMYSYMKKNGDKDDFLEE